MSFEIRIDRIDHIVLTVRDITATCRFYTQILGMREITFAGSRKALVFGNQKINLHKAGQEFEPKAYRPTPGAADLCLIATTPMPDIVTHLRKHDVEIIEGPVHRTGAQGSITSVYFRDPDLNLREVSNYHS